MITREQINKRIIKLREELENRGIVKTRGEFAKALGTYSHVIGKIEKGTRNFTLEMIILLVKEYGDYLNPNSLFEYGEERDNIVFLTQAAAAAGPSLPTEPRREVERFKIPGLGGDLFAFPIEGNSMDPTLESGDVLICREVKETFELKEDHVYVVINREGIKVKRIKINKEESVVVGVTLVSDNKRIAPIEVDFSQGLHNSHFIKFYRPVKRITENGLI